LEGGDRVGRVRPFQNVGEHGDRIVGRPIGVGALGPSDDDVGLVFGSAAREPDMGAGPRGSGGEDGVGGVGGAALDGVNGRGVTELHPVGHVAGVEHNNVGGAGPG
jgi:hypothetical protein